MCGIIGIIANQPVAQDLYDGMTLLQHRGQDAAGIMTYSGQRFHEKKGLGLVKEVFRSRSMARLKGNAGIGHVRYPTIGGVGIENAQPFSCQMPYGIAMAQNGNLFNFYELKKQIAEEDLCNVSSECDVEAILHIFRSSLIKLAHKNKNQFAMDHLWKACKKLFSRARGGYSIVGYIGGKGLIAFRDPHGIRPLVMGKRSTEGKPDEYIFASESVAVDILGFELMGDVAPGEMVVIDEDRNVHRKIIHQEPHRPCVFEHIYLARPDSLMDNISVHKARMRMGELLGKKIKKANLQIDVVMPVPDSAREAALAASVVLKKPYREGLIKNRYIGRTFIMPDQGARQKSIRYKLTPIILEVRRKNILLVDDSIVRGNTSKAIIDMMREAGANKVYFASASPPLRNPCYYGIDMPTREEFVANKLTEEEIAKKIGADALFYQDIEDLAKAVRYKKKNNVKRYCMACLDGKYPVGDFDDATLTKWEEQRKRSHAELEKNKNGLPVLQ
ncbi:MAG: amidophosphoribosyltransferase [bacterium]|nr:amidophosphoribosyltransferase [bacterium]